MYYNLITLFMIFNHILNFLYGANGAAKIIANKQ